MSEPFEYSVRSSGISWLVYVKINCKVSALDSHPDDVIDVSPQIKLVTKGTGILADEIVYAIKGIEIVEPYLLPKLAVVPSIVHITEFTTNDVDYQPEGLTYAVAGWLNREYKLNWTPGQVSYDPLQERYIFPFNI